jgi:hypothetical protein
LTGASLGFIDSPAMNEQTMLSSRAIMGLVLMGLSLLGGAVATYFNVHNAVGPKERAFAARVCTVSWLIAASMLIFVYFLPSPHRFVVAGLYLLICPPLVYKWTNTHQLIRMIEQRELEEIEEELAKEKAEKAEK